MDKILNNLAKFCNKIAKKLFRNVLKAPSSLNLEIKEFEKEFLKESKRQNLDEIVLSKALYKSTKEIKNSAEFIIKEYLKSSFEAKNLAKKLYEGYNFKDDPLKVLPKLPKYLTDECINLAKKNANKLKTPSLKAAYLEALKAKSKANFEKKLKIALYEKARFYAQRIALTETSIEHFKKQASEFMEDEFLEVVKFKMSHTHPRPDICDYFANSDFWGLGKGIYPKEKAPTLPLHPFCRCILIPQYHLKRKGAIFNKNAGKDYIKSLPLNKQTAILGSKNRLDKFNNGADFLTLYNALKPDRYKVRSVKELLKLNRKSEI